MIFGNQFDLCPRVRVVSVNQDSDLKFLGELGYVVDQEDAGRFVRVKLDNFHVEKIFWHDQIEVYREEAFGVIGTL